MSSLLHVSQKCQYALRAIFELAIRHRSNTVTTVAEIAETQMIPPRFLEQIFLKLRTGGYIKSRRGNKGGYVLAIAPEKISIGEIIRFVEGPDESVDCLKSSGSHCPFRGRCAFKELWERAKSAMSGIFDVTTFQDLVEKQKKLNHEIDYSI